MIIEIYAPYAGVSDLLIDSLKEEVSSLSHITRDISRAEISIWDDNTVFKNNKMCEIRLTIFGGSLFVHKRTTSFKRSASRAVEDLEKQLRENIKTRRELPDEIFSTVDV